MHPERGALLFRTRSLHRRGNALVSAISVLASVPWVLDSYRLGWRRDKLLLGVLYAVMFGAAALVGLRGVGFYENGISFPQEPAGPRPRFVPWSAIERYHWDGDILTVVAAASVLSTGGGEPLTGGSVKVAPSQRAEVERLLARGSAASRA